MKTNLQSRNYLIIEFILMCVVLPTIIIVFKLAPHMFTFLWVTAGYCFFIYRKTNPDTIRQIWNWSEVTWQNMQPILLRWLLVTIFLFLFTKIMFPERLFFLQREKPEILPMILTFYPILSALPQEFIFCSFFFRRYERFWGNSTMMVIVSAIVFAYAHILYINWVAPLLSIVAGVIFASTYRKHKSLAIITIEHALYGNSLFFMGLGWFFWGGALEE